VRRQRRDKAEAGREICGPADLRDVGVEARHANEPAVAERRERIEYVVAGEIAVI
jgi:hypothetical protein